MEAIRIVDALNQHIIGYDGFCVEVSFDYVTARTYENSFEDGNYEYVIRIDNHEDMFWDREVSFESPGTANNHSHMILEANRWARKIRLWKVSLIRELKEGNYINGPFRRPLPEKPHYPLYVQMISIPLLGLTVRLLLDGYDLAIEGCFLKKTNSDSAFIMLPTIEQNDMKQIERRLFRLHPYFRVRYHLKAN